MRLIDVFIYFGVNIRKNQLFFSAKGNTRGLFLTKNKIPLITGQFVRLRGKSN